MAPTTPPVRTLVVMRHAHYDIHDPNQKLTQRGEQEALGAAISIKAQIGDRSVKILTSEQPRAKLTGAIIAESYRVSPQPVPWLSASNYPDNIRDHMYDVLAHMPVDGVLMLVTHLPQVELFTGIFEAPHCQPYIEDIPA